MTTFIYTLSIENDIRYVGKSNAPFGRLKKHLKECKLKRTKKEKWLFSLKEKGITPKLEILDEVSETDWSFYEKYWISQLKCWGFNLLNGTEGGEGSDGFRGKKHSNETKNKCKESALKNRKLSDDDILEIRNSKEDRIHLMKKHNISRSTYLRVLDGNYKLRGGAVGSLPGS